VLLMYVSQHDVAQVSTDDLKRLVVAAYSDPDPRLHPLWAAFGQALMKAIRERQRALRFLEADALDDDGLSGELLEPDTPAYDADRWSPS
jgi:hypothetical protein